jgi:hypothetical protein
MKDESLMKAVSIITDVIIKSDIDPVDKMELLINLQNLLMNYKESIDVLRKKR